jgi:phage recombination protein Bet
MSTALAQLNNSMTMWDDNQKLEEIRKLFAPKLTEMEFQFFVGLGKATGLNPFVRELWSIKYQDNMPAQVFVGRDGYRKASQAHKDYDFHQADAVFENDDFEVINGEVLHKYKLKDRGRLVGAYCIVKRKSSSRPMYVFVELSEYDKKQSVWKEKPATMIKKVAEAQCLRACFQYLLGGTYCPEEAPEQPKQIDGATQTEKLKNALKEPQIIDAEIEEEPPKAHYSGRDDILINDDQLDQISSLMIEKEFTEERIMKALNYYKVDCLESLTDAQARLFLLQLGKA